MPRLRLTERAIARIEAPQPSGKQVIFWDQELRGFGLLASGVTKAKTYIVQRTLPNGNSRRVTVAAINETSLTMAREQAAELLLDMRRGNDPKAGRRGAVTLQQTLEAYLDARKDLRPRSAEFYRSAVQHHLPDWLDLPLRDLSPEMIERRHHDIGGSAANSTMRTLRVLWNFALDRTPDLPANPIRRLRKQWFPAPRRTRMVPFADLPKFYQAVGNLSNAVWRDYLLLLLFTGLRRREAATLTWNDIDLPGRAIRIPGIRTKSGTKLDLPMSSAVHDLLVARRRESHSQYVFEADSHSGHLEEPKFALRQVAEASGIAESADISPLALKALVNHTLGNDVTAGYVQMTVERLRQPAQRVTDKMLELCGVEPVVSDVKVVRLP
jgi:integrase